MAQLLAVARKSYDCIVIEIAPILSVVDIKMIERFVDQFVFVLQWGETKRNVLLNALSDAEIICDRIAGVVLNKADPVALKHAEALDGIRPGSYYQD
jgi:succinoglycan biosynthesis transport protein ExoP